MKGLAVVTLLVAVVAVEVTQDDAGVLPVFRSLIPPTKEERSDIMHPLEVRSAPLASDNKKPASAFADFSISPRPSPQPVDVTTITIGNCIEHRGYMDYQERMEIVFPGIQFPSDGTISSWQMYTGRDCDIEAQVFRKTSIPKQLDENKFPVSNFELVGTNVFSIPALGNYTFDVPESSRITVREGDVIGFFTESPGCISWSDGGPQTLFRYSKAGHREMKEFGGVVYIGDGVHRTYSISATGHFRVPKHDLQQRASPSVTPSGSTIVGSPSPTQSPSGSVSATSVQSPSPSQTAEPSVSPTSSPSFSPSTSISMYTREYAQMHCAEGYTFWCASSQNMELCNVTQSTCDVIKTSMALSPVPVPLSPGATPSSTASPSLMVSAEHVLPSPTPSTSLVVAPFLEEPEEGSGGVSNCNYCNGGTDWTSGVCLSGKNQSPVAINFEEVTTDAKMDLYFSVRYEYVRAQVSWNDYAFMVRPFSTNGTNTSINTFGMINLDATNYDAQVAFIHSPSEHQLQGTQTPMELQIYHLKRGSNPPVTVAVSILFEESLDDQQNLMWIYDIPKDKSPFPIVVDMEEFLSDLRPLVFYNGSFTQPPCTEGVTWAVSMKTAKIGYNQLQYLNKFLKNNRAFAGGRGNNRVLQNLNGRQLVLRSNCGMTGSNMECGEGGKVTAAIVPEEKGGAVDEGLFDDDGVKLW